MIQCGRSLLGPSLSRPFWVFAKLLRQQSALRVQLLNLASVSRLSNCTRSADLTSTFDSQKQECGSQVQMVFEIILRCFVLRPS